jgi:hypothetical protein
MGSAYDPPTPAGTPAPYEEMEFYEQQPPAVLPPPPPEDYDEIDRAIGSIIASDYGEAPFA